jgi:2-polyprenyl-6-methoxyphenol hydroxylase-like FAD-dependent oxidoreductase
MKILIVGAGLGGLCLAHGLLRGGHQVQVLERRSGPEGQPASYGIHLNADGLRALHACLPADNWRQLVATSVTAPDIVRFHDRHLDVLAVRDGDSQQDAGDPVTRRRAVRRDDLRDALLLGLNARTTLPADIIRWGARLSRYEEHADGTVTAHCVDGARYTADLIVGADGSNSVVRTQRLPHLHREDLAIVNIAGRVPLTPETTAHLPATLIDGAVNNIVPAGPGWMFVSTWPASHDRDDRFAVWAWAAARDSYPADLDTLTPAALTGHVAERITRWAPALRFLVDHTDPSTVTTVGLRTMPTLPAWQPSGVTLLGDAIHNMTPMAGIGANTALRDADELRRRLLAPGDADLVARVGAYENAMRGYANHALALSTRNARNAAATARLPRLAFRTVLRIAEAIPPVKRQLFGPTAKADRQN